MPYFVGNTIENCYYDKQMCLQKGKFDPDDWIKDYIAAGQQYGWDTAIIYVGSTDINAEGLQTKELVGTTLQAMLGNTDWTYNTNLYPMIKGLEDEIISKVAASPVFLCTDNIDYYDVYNNVRHHFEISKENDVEWQSRFNRISISNTEVTITTLGTDTLFAGIDGYRKIIPLSLTNMKNCADITPPDNYYTKFTIRASEHKLVSPDKKNYRVPIYITANEDILGVTIEKLVIKIDGDIYRPRNIQYNNGKMTRNLIDTIQEIVIENIKVPDLKAGVESVLLTIRGDVSKGTRDSNAIQPTEVVFAKELNDKVELIDGYITLAYVSLAIKDNPVKDDLDVICKVFEKGNYSLEICDMLGKTAVLKEWSVTENVEQEFNFTIPVLKYASACYFLILHTPSDIHSEKFIIYK
jgi:hypothetical protein